MCSPGSVVGILPYNFADRGACLDCRIFLLRRVGGPGATTGCGWSVGLCCVCLRFLLSWNGDLWWLCKICEFYHWLYWFAGECGRFSGVTLLRGGLAFANFACLKIRLV